MFKHLLSAVVAGTLALGAFATESTVVFTYAGNQISPWGKSKSETYDVAIRLSDPALAGKRIVGMSALLFANDSITETSMWLSKELKLEKKVNIPDTYSAPVELKNAKDSVTIEVGEDSTMRRPLGLLENTLETPYEITSDGIYVGYTLTVPSAEKGKKLTEMQKYPLLLSYSDKADSYYIHASKSILQWKEYNTQTGNAAVIRVILEGDFPEHSVGFKNMKRCYAQVNSDFEVSVVLGNLGLAAAESIDYNYTVNGVTREGHYIFPEPLPNDLVNDYRVILPFGPIETLGATEMDVTITKVNGQENVSSAATSQVTVDVVPYLTIHRPLVEEFTGTWCGWCTRGYIAMELLAEEFGDDVVLAAYHNGDPMAVTNAFPVNVSGFPSASLERTNVVDPYMANAYEGFGMRTDVLECIATMPPCNVKVTAVWADDAKTEIDITSDATFVIEAEDAGYTVGYLLVANGLTGTGNGWAQHNYYSGQAVSDPNLKILTTWPGEVSNLVFNDVVVDVDGYMGVENSLPSTIEVGETYEQKWSYDITNNKVIQDKDKLWVMAFVIDENGRVINANKAHVTNLTGLTTINADATEVSADYFDLAGRRVAAPVAGMFIKVAKMSDGTVRTSKVAVR